MEDEEDVHLLAECLCRDGQYQRALFRLKNKGLLEPTNTRFRALAAKCLVRDLKTLQLIDKAISPSLPLSLSLSRHIRTYHTSTNRRGRSSGKSAWKYWTKQWVLLLQKQRHWQTNTQANIHTKLARSTMSV